MSRVHVWRSGGSSAAADLPASPRSFGARLGFRGLLGPSALFPSPRGRRVGSSGLSAGRGVLQAARTTALVAAVTTASAGGEDERVRKGEGQQAGARRAGERGVGRRTGRALPARRDSRQDRASGGDFARLLGHSASGGGGGLGRLLAGFRASGGKGASPRIQPRERGCPEWDNGEKGSWAPRASSRERTTEPTQVLIRIRAPRCGCGL